MDMENKERNDKQKKKTSRNTAKEPGLAYFYFGSSPARSIFSCQQNTNNNQLTDC